MAHLPLLEGTRITENLRIIETVAVLGAPIIKYHKKLALIGLAAEAFKPTLHFTIEIINCFRKFMILFSELECSSQTGFYC